MIMLYVVGRGLALLRRAAAFALIAAVVGYPSLVRAQADEQRAAARSIALDGARACSEARWQDCVDLFRRAESVVHAPPHLLYMARAEEKLGHLVRARELYLRITRERLADNAPPAFRESQTAAADGAQKLDPRISFLTVQLTGDGGKAVEVTMDGEPVPSAFIGVARPVDPGEHRIEGKGPGLVAKPETTTLAEGARGAVTLTFEAVPEAEVTALTPAAAAAPLASGSPALDSGAADDSTQVLRIASYASFGVGAVGLGLGTVFALMSSSKRSDADKLFAAQCPCAKTDPAAKQVASLDDSARSAGTLSVVGFVVGGAGVAAGGVLFFLSSKKKSSPTAAAHITPWVGLASAGVSGTY